MWSIHNENSCDKNNNKDHDETKINFQVKKEAEIRSTVLVTLVTAVTEYLTNRSWRDGSELKSTCCS